ARSLRCFAPDRRSIRATICSIVMTTTMPACAGYSATEIEAGRKLFAGDWQFAAAAGTAARLPAMAGLEVAFAGRSNVGKSSLINALTGRKALARTSHTP